MREKKLIEDEKLRLLVLKSFIEQGQKIDEYLEHFLEEEQLHGAS